MKTDNELIAEFMKLDKHPNNQRAYWIEDQDCYLTFDNLQFHKSWNQLMPVVEKIGYMKENYSVEIGVFYNPVSIRFQECAITGKDSSIIVKYSGLPLIECSYKAVVDFIKWYNSQTQ